MSVSQDVQVEAAAESANASGAAQCAEVTAASTQRRGKRTRAADKALLARLRGGLIGNRAPLPTPFGLRPLVYADYTASGRAIDFIEDNIRSRVLPFYANTHSEASFTGAQTNALREEARDAIRRAVNAGPQDRVIFCGAGATAAINQLIGILGLRLPVALDERFDLRAQIPVRERPVIFVGPYEHHSNELPWRETIADVVRIGLDDAGAIDRSELARRLEEYRERPLRIGSFSAASNVTGVISDVAGITAQLKDAGALAFWDYAAGGPYLPVDMNPGDTGIDAIFISPHKFVGGPGTAGVLLVKDALLCNRVPAVVGGGTVRYVSPTGHTYVDNPERREEGGTPAIVECIRAGAVFALKERIGSEAIEAMETALVARAFAHFADTPNLQVLGSTSLARLGIFSLRFLWGQRDLHHSFVAALLNDLFGIQARGGCSCAGPYGHDLLHIDAEKSRALDAAVSAGYGCLKPGWLRINLHYVAPEAEIDYLLNALRLVAELGWRLLPAYRLDPQSGTWRHREVAPELPVQLNDLLAEPSAPSFTGRPLGALLQEGEALLRAGASAEHCSAAINDPAIDPAFSSLRWYATTQEAASVLLEAQG